jgi:hypothetical protein
MNDKKKYVCNCCVKEYLNYKSLWSHNKKFHNGIKMVKEKTIIEYGCRICNNIYQHSQSRFTHEKTCTGIKQQPNIELEVEKMKQATLDKEQDTEKIKQDTLDKEQKILELKIKLQSMKRLDTKTFKSVNKLLMDRSTINNNTQNITNNNNHYHLQIMSLGNENVVDTLSFQEKKQILDRRLCSLDKMIEIVHCGTHNMFKNIIITNLKDKFAYRYDETKGYFITENKSDVLDILVENRMMDIEAIYDELSTANKIDGRTKKLIQEFLDKMENKDTPFLYDTVEYPNYKSYKINNIKILLYNNQDKITKDIALLMN